MLLPSFCAVNAPAGLVADNILPNSEPNAPTPGIPEKTTSHIHNAVEQ